MDKNTWIGFGLIAAIILGFSLMNRPSQEELAERQRVNDSIAMEQAWRAELQAQELAIADSLAEVANRRIDSAAAVPQRENETIVLQNNHLRLHLQTKGGNIARAELLEYRSYGDTVNPLCLFRADEQRMAYTLITQNNRILSTEHLFFEPIVESDSVVRMRWLTDVEDAYMDWVYTLPADDYMVRIAIEPHNMQQVLAHNMGAMELLWYQRIGQHEKGRKFEERYAQLQYMLVGGDMEKLSESKHDTKKESARIKWLGYKDQFFSSVLIADEAFTSTEMESTPLDKYSGYIKEYTTRTSVPFDFSERPIGFSFYLGPNHYNTLKAYDKDVEKQDRLHLKSLVPLGWKIVAWVNIILIIPMFDLFTSWGLHIGLIILLMTIVVKLIILPFIYKSYQSSAKMRVLKPQLDAIAEKFPPEKMQERQQAQMALYQKAGVSPMSGCLPMLFQMPVVMALFWFFPTAIELRGKSFLWADDLSTYDDLIHWGFDLPFIGDHLSLFCILFTIVNIVYSYLNMQSQAGGNDPSMKMMRWMMYLMPLMFFFIFNDYAAGLSYYYLLSLFFSIVQTMIFRWAIDDEKLLAEMERKAAKNASKPKSGFMKRLEEMQRQQQQMAREQAKKAQRR